MSYLLRKATLTRGGQVASGFLLICSGLLLASGCYTHKGVSSPERHDSLYPVWFVRSPIQDGNLIAVGYSQEFIRKQSSAKMASSDACQRLAKCSKVTIHGKHAIENTVLGRSWRGQIIKEWRNGVSPAEGLHNCVKLDTAFVDGMVIVLASLKRIEIDTTRVPITHKRSWVDSLPQSDDYIYAVGVAPKYFRQTASWIEAERAAKLELAYIQKSRVLGLSRKESSALGDVTVQEFESTLFDVQIVERYIDEDSGTYYVLARSRRMQPQ